MGLMRIPYTAPLPSPTIIPATAASISGAIASLYDFLTAPDRSKGTLLLTGAGISVASGLADYRGTAGTYTLNKTYRPIYFHEFCASHEARKRYWARSFLGWTNLHKSRPNPTHHAVADLADMGLVSSVITQNVDSFHKMAHPQTHTIELHGYLRTAVCLSCRQEYDRSQFQLDLRKLNPPWANFLDEMLESGALTTEHPEERRKKGLKTNPDGDVDVPGVEYNTFKYPPCPSCAERPPTIDGKRGQVDVDKDGSWLPASTAGILKPNVIMFGESIPASTKEGAEAAVDDASSVLVLGSSLATYSAWRLVKRAKDANMPIAIANLGGVRGEEQFLKDVFPSNTGRDAVRCAHPTEKLLPRLVTALKEGSSMALHRQAIEAIG
ncbi:hypothetical protein KVT40_004633 [Elsinoe batatas]|uniref:Deacetylase sirtuin-type domain-containing protein n=1 Tax=Elsinoe batatas TaxID=2601811 RepID=A0A8K0PCN9_9PEZI|nr:hypothetical protein KVT40_004633 [Elsinoe batatas]